GPPSRQRWEKAASAPASGSFSRPTCYGISPEAVFGDFMEDLSRRQFGGREIGMIGRVRIMLGLERNGAVRHVTFVQRHLGPHRIAAVDLYAGLGRPHFHHPT